MSPLVTAIVPTYNRAGLLVRALASIAEQDYRPIQVIIVDDGSTDGTAQIIPAQHQFLRDRGIELVYHCQPNGGPAKARNTGIGMASGELITFLDSDDLWRPGFVSTLAGLMQSYPSAGVAFCTIQGIDINDKVFAERSIGVPGDVPTGLLARPFDFLIDHMALQTSGVMVRARALADVGVFDLSLAIGEDWDLWYRLSMRYDFTYTTAALACNRIHSNNIPKWDARALALGLTLNLKYFPVATSDASRHKLRDRIDWHMTLLQEEILRLGNAAEHYRPLLSSEYAPRTMRFELGQLFLQQPEWVGRLYAALVRGIGTVLHRKAAHT